MKKIFKIFRVFILVGLLIQASALMAQKGPLPGMNFKLFYGAEAFTHPDTIYQIQSHTADFQEPDTIGKFGKSEGDFSCFDKNNCISTSKGYKKYQKLVLVFGSRFVTSEVFEPSGFISDYEVRMSEKGVVVENQTPFFYRNTALPGFLKNMLITILAEVLFSLVILRIFNYHNTRGFIKFLIPANLISMSGFWWIIMPLMNNPIGYFIGLVFMVMVESLIIWFGIKKEIPFGKNLSIVFFVNLMGLIAGGFLKFMAYFGIATRFFW